VESKKVFTGFIWRFLERCGAQIVTLIVSIVLARLLEPEAYGTVALISVFVTILGIFIDSGLGTALVQKKDADDLDFSTVFYFNLFFCGVVYTLLFFAAPLIAAFYNNEALTPLVRVIGLTLIVSGVKNVQCSYVSRTMQFKKFFWATLIGTVISAVIGIVMAYRGMGAWALIAQSLSNNAIDTVILWIVVKWRPKWMFSFQRLKQLFSFGWKLLVSALLDTVYNNLRSLIIGKLYSTEDLAYYNKGRNYPNTITTIINTSISTVLLPAMSSEQDKRERVKAMTRRAIKTSVYLMAPLMIGLASCSTNVVSLILTDKWLPIVPYMIIFCITYVFYPIHTANLNAIQAMGRSDLFLKLEIIKKVVGLAVLLSTMWFGVMAMAYSLLFTSVVSQIINSWPNRKLLNYSYLDQLKDILPSILLAAFMGACVYFIGWIPLPTVAILLIQIVAGAIIYIAGSIIFKFESFTYLWNLIKSFFQKRKEAK
jgi:O-antigen/teichoic acid export membrane protein